MPPQRRQPVKGQSPPLRRRDLLPALPKPVDRPPRSPGKNLIATPTFPRRPPRSRNVTPLAQQMAAEHHHIANVCVKVAQLIPSSPVPSLVASITRPPCWPVALESSFVHQSSLARGREPEGSSSSRLAKMKERKEEKLGVVHLWGEAQKESQG